MGLTRSAGMGLTRSAGVGLTGCAGVGSCRARPPGHVRQGAVVSDAVGAFVGDIEA
jgi:hypothetical protein